MSVRLLVVITLVLAASGLGIRHSGRLGGGSDASRGEFPYMVSLQWTVRPNPEVHVCGGAVIDKDWIITAASCLSQPGDGYLRVVSGEHDFDSLEETEQEAIVDYYNIPPGYSSVDFADDLAVVHVKPSLTVNDFTKPVLLPQPGAVGSGVGTVSGWSDMTQVLQGSRVNVSSSCSAYVVYPALCSAPGPVYACQGDRGSPLVEVNASGLRELLGVVTGIAPCSAASPIVFTQVSNYVDFINTTIASYIP